MESLERSLQKAAPSPEMLDVSVSIIIPSKNVKIPRVFVKPTNSIFDFYNEIYEYFIKLNNPILKVDKDNLFIL